MATESEKNLPVTQKTPRWNSNTKLVVALTFVAILAGCLIKFREFLGPLLLGFILTYLAYPIVEFVHRRFKIAWKLATFLLYIFGVIIILSLLVWGGIALVEQVQSLIRFLQNAIDNLPAFISQLSRQVIRFGPFELNFQTLDLRDWVNQIIGMIQPMFSKLGSFVGSLASSAVSVIGWLLFVILISFFIVSESGGNPGKLFNIEIPGYTHDVRRLGIELSRIWNSFLRGQLILILITILIYSFLLGVLQVRFFFGLAILAGLARFVPYVGPAITWTTYGLVTYFQGYTVFGLTPWGYVLLVIGISIVVDSMIDNIVTPSLMAGTLKVHPAAVLVAVLMAASLMGIVGILMAAPVLASGKLIGNYAYRKMFDLDPWEGQPELEKQPSPVDWNRWKENIQAFINRVIHTRSGNK